MPIPSGRGYRTRHVPTLEPPPTAVADAACRSTAPSSRAEVITR